MKRDKRQVRGFQEWQPAFARFHIRTVGSLDATKHSETYQESVRNRAATQGADGQVRGAATMICTMSKAVTMGALREKGATLKEFDRAGKDAKKAQGPTLHHLESRPVRVMERKDDAGGVFAWGKVSRVSEPMGGNKNF